MKLTVLISSSQTIIALACAILLSACGATNKPKPGDPYYAPTVSPAQAMQQRTDGSLYQDSYGLSLFGDRKAHFVGDILTVTLSESTVSKKSANVNVKKDNSQVFNSGAGTLLGTDPTLGKLNLGTNVAQNRKFGGNSGADQSNSLQGNITVTVAEIMPNGNLVVRGEKWMTLNSGDEFIRISGIVRPDDVAPDNTVLSTRLANAKISYSGTGSMADSQNMGWLAKFFNSPIWPF
ncbi:flagellar basal body L-ring protein FlgH [Cellvibrio sp.]|uniref:flagellar basal body L-ring protein FlgH n=1 Tax=Cellvibrio sp. TaxID=1965322 RepID=UPI0039647BB3